MPLARAGIPLVGIDLSEPMLDRARTRFAARVSPLAPVSSAATSAGCRSKPTTFALVAAPYGILQSLVRDRDLAATLSAVAAALRPGGRLVVELVADLPAWREYREETKLRGWRPGRRAHLTLVESVRQDRRRGLTIFDQEFIERRGRLVSSRRFALAFRTLSVPQMARRLERAGLRVAARLGSYEVTPGPGNPRPGF